MTFISNFYKLLIIILLIIVIFKLLNNMSESFTTMVVPPISPESTNTKKILFTIKKFNDTSIELTWDNDSNNTVSKYIIIKYVNNNGPYLTVLPNTSNRNIIDNIHTNIIYKIGIVSISKDDEAHKQKCKSKPDKNTCEEDPNCYYNVTEKKCDATGISNLKDNIKQFSFSVFNDTPEVKYINSFKNNIYCDAKGQHKIIGKCPDKNSHTGNNIIATYTKKIPNSLNETSHYFCDKEHTKLMDSLNNPSEDTIYFELKI